VTSDPAITLKRLDRTTIRVHGLGFPAAERAKVILSDKPASRSVGTKIDPRGRFTVSLDIPPIWTGTIRAVATAKSGSVSARRTLRLN
jgi:hypothetical protein